MTRTMIPGAALAAALVLGGCATGGERMTERPGTATQEVLVENHGWDDVAVYALRGSSRFRLGTVSGMTTQRMVLTPGMLSADGTVEFLLRAIPTTSEYRSGPLLVCEGRQIRLDVRHDLPTSSSALYPAPGW